MFILSHLVAGLIIGKLMHHYLLAIASALLVDVDHLIPYFKHNVLFSAKKFWKIVTNPDDPYGNQRNYLHSFFTWFIVSSGSFYELSDRHHRISWLPQSFTLGFI